MQKKTVLGSGIALAALSCGAAAQESGNASSAASAGTPTVVISSKRLEETLPQQLAKLGNDVEVVSGEQIVNRGYNDVAETLRMTTPGLYISPKNGPFDYVDVSLQGSRTNEILWLVDGVRISNRLYNGTTPLDTIPAHMIERIEVLKGGQSLFYGTQAVAGAINVITKSIPEDRDGTVEVGGDSNDGWHASGFWGGTFGTQQLAFYASKDKSEGYQPFETSAYQPSGTDRNREYDVASAGIKYAHDFSETLRFSAQYQHTNAELGFARPFIVASAFNERNEEIMSAKLDYAPSDAFQLFFKTYYHDWDSHYTELDNDPANPGAVPEVVDPHEFWGYEDFGLNALAKIAVNKGFEYLVGYDFQNYNGRDEVLLIDDQTERVNAVFGQVRTTPELLKNTSLAAGVRFNRSGAGESTTVWNVSGRYDPSERFFIGGTAGTSFRLPDAYELFAIDPFDVRGNPNLVGEKSHNLNVSIGGRFGMFARTVNWRLTGFARRIEKLIDAVDDGTENGVFANTDEEVKVGGGELILNTVLSESLKADLGFTSTRAHGDSGYDQLPGVPREFIKAALAYDPPARAFGGSLTANYVGKVYDTVSGFGRVEHGNYTMVDLAGYFYLDRNRHQHRISARLENAFDEDYATSLGRGVTDDTGENYIYGNRGMPRTFHLMYQFSF